MALDFGVSDEHAMLADTLRRFAQAESNFEQRAARLKAPSPARMALWGPLADLGTFAALVPEALGGFGGTPADMAVVQEALAPSLLVEPILTSAVICAYLLRAAREPDPVLIEGVIDGRVVLALAYGEGFDPFAPPRLEAARRDGGVTLTGFKPAVRHADVATHIIAGGLSAGEAALFLVPVDSAGLGLAPIRAIDAAGAADLRFDAVDLPASALIALDDPAAAVADALEWGLVGLAVETAGIVAASNRATFDYLGVREQFGTKLAQFQALQHIAANMAIAGEEAAAMAAMAVERLSAEPTPARSAAILRASIACDAAGRAASHSAVQLFGGMGVSDELAISHYARRLAAIRAQIGTVDARAARLSAIEGNG